MNFALPAVLLFLIVLPGFIFRARLKLVEKESQDFSPFGQVVTEGVVSAVFLHALALAVTYWGFDRSVRIDVLVHLLVAPASLTQQDYAQIAQSWLWISQYFGSLLVGSLIVPSLLRHGITTFRWDRYGSLLSGWFRFHRAPWYYLLSKADYSKKESEEIIITVAAIVNVAGTPYLYHGFLDEYFTGRDGELDRVVLTRTERRRLSSDKSLSDVAGVADELFGKEDARFYPIEGDYFVIRYSEMITLNVHYFRAR